MQTGDDARGAFADGLLSSSDDLDAYWNELDSQRNSRTYNTLDELENEARRRKDTTLKVYHRGKCERYCQKYVPICGTDDKTYNNVCFLEEARSRDGSLRKQYDGQCEGKPKYPGNAMRLRQIVGGNKKQAYRSGSYRRCNMN
ncbi:kazal-type serine protease inhibitor domain-containing protein [Phthorimaea operculella]|nr:kazal-type serine protease inhibitor domain-containing protein [Phthorimaea operculella]